MRWITLIILTLSALLTACAPESPVLPTAAATLPPAPTQEVIENSGGQDGDLILGEQSDGLFTASITGSTTITLAGPGAYTCIGGTEELTIQTGDGQLTISIPPGTPAAEYTLGTGSDTISATLVIGQDTYSQDIFGIITLETAASAAGDTVSGSFDLNFSSTGGDSVNAVGTFNLPAGSTC